MVTLLLGTSLASAAGFWTSASWTDSYGPDAYAQLQVAAQARPGLEVGALMVGGTRSALYGDAARTLRLGQGVQLRGELRLGMVEDDGADAGFGLGARVAAGPLTAVAEGGWTGGLGWQILGGVDAPLSERWTLRPRLRAETWAGDRDVALRAGLGLRHDGARGLWWALDASAGGRDVFHLGPGVSLIVGRTP